jgi:hypothetical protein
MKTGRDVVVGIARADEFGFATRGRWSPRGAS